MKDFKEQIKKGNIEVIDQNSLIIENYPYGFKTCKMTFNKIKNRNGQIISRTSDLNGKISKPKKTTSARLNIFIYDKELKRHFILMVNGLSMSIYNTNFKMGGVYETSYFNLTDKESFIIFDFNTCHGCFPKNFSRVGIPFDLNFFISKHAVLQDLSSTKNITSDEHNDFTSIFC